MMRHYCFNVALLVFALTLVVALVACRSAATTAPSPPTAAPIEQSMAYTVNVPDLVTAVDLRRAHPDGVAMSPIAAQLAFDYTRSYGSPNVYYGVVAPPEGRYLTGIVVAPVGAASASTFTASDWPAAGLDPRVTYRWIGYFEFTRSR